MVKTFEVGLALGLVLMFLTVQPHVGALQVGFYDGKCGNSDVEDIVAGVVAEKFADDLTVPAALIRLQFHDCFVKGCDASILLDGSNSEKTAIASQTVRGYEIIDAAKAAVEEECSGLVSCADIIVMATRDAVYLGGGERYSVETGRRDGFVSLAKNVNVPGPSISVSDSIKVFANKGLDVLDMTYLLGAHTVGIAHCSLFKDRLYNFQNTGQPDPTMSHLQLMRNKCPQNANIDNKVHLDQNSRSDHAVDNSFYQQILLHRGVLQIDQQLALDPRTRDIVTRIAHGSDFSTKFGEAMVKLGAVDVLTGTQGEIRDSCRVINQ